MRRICNRIMDELAPLACTAIPKMIDQETGGSTILTSSAAGLVAMGNLAHYTSTKHGVTGLMQALAVELAPRHPG